MRMHICGCIGVIRLLLASVGTAYAAPPHIVLFIGDDLSWHDIGPYRNGDVRTPHLDQLATESMRCRREFSASPPCAPSRSEIYTGLDPVRSGGHANHIGINDGVTTL